MYWLKRMGKRYLSREQSLREKRYSQQVLPMEAMGVAIPHTDAIHVNKESCVLWHS